MASGPWPLSGKLVFKIEGFADIRGWVRITMSMMTYSHIHGTKDFRRLLQLIPFPKAQSC